MSATAALSGATAGMALGPWGAIAGGLIGGISSIFSGQSEADAINEKIRRAQALAAESLIDNEEISSRLNSIDRMFNQRLTSTLNTTAIRSRGFANSGTIGAAVAGGVEGDRLASKSQVVNQSLDFNKQVKGQIAQMELGTTSANPIADFITGATSGVQLGMEATRYLGNVLDIPSTGGLTPQQSIERGQNMPKPMSQAGNKPMIGPQNSPEINLPQDISSITSGVDAILQKLIPPSSNVGSGVNNSATGGQTWEMQGATFQFDPLEMMKTYQSTPSRSAVKPSGFEWWRPNINPNHHQGGY